MSLDRLLIPTKFAPPRLSPQATPRTALLRRLRDARDSRLTLICGGAGFGKTTLLAQWRQELAKAGERVAWLSLSSDERQAPQFCVYLFGALQQLGLAIDGDTDMPAGAHSGLVAAVVEAVNQWGRDVFLIVDDYHHVEDAAVHAFVQGLLDHGPDELRLIIASRTQPPLILGRMRMTGELAEISLPDLPFDFHETQDFLAKQLGDVTADDARLIHDLTEGWPLCLQMICIRLKRGPTTRATLTQMLDRRADLQHYLAEDVFEHLPDNVAEFMEKISVCRRFNAELAAQVTGDPQAIERLDRIERDNLFLLPVEIDSPTPWYRLHPLFAKFLQNRLRNRNPAALREANARAAQWFADQGLLIECLRHAYYANDFDAAARMVERADLPLRSMSFIGTMLHWMEQLSPEVLLRHSRLLALGCWALVATSRWRDAQIWIDRAEQQAELDPYFAVHARYLRASIALQRDDSEAALAQLVPMDFEALTDRFLRQVHLAVLSFCYCAAGRYAEARELHRRGARLPRAESQDDMAMVAESTPLLSHLLEGDYPEAIRIGAPLVARAEAIHGRRSVSASTGAAFLADAYYESDELALAHDALANRLDLLRYTSPEPMIRALIAHRRLTAVQVSAEEALRGLADDEAHCRDLALDRPLAHVLAEQARMQLRLKRLDAARELQRELDQLAERYRGSAGLLAEIEAIAALTATRLALASGEWAEALLRVEALRRHGLAYGRQRRVALAELLSGAALSGLGHFAAAVPRLTAGVEVAQRLGLVRMLLDEGDVLMNALQRLQPALPAGPVSGYLADVLQRAERARAAMRKPAHEADLAGEALKPREIEILRLVAQAMPNKRIALTLNITLETVKWNLKSVFAKLGAASRYDAVTAARKRGLIE